MTTEPISTADIRRFMSDIDRDGGALYRKADVCWPHGMRHWIGEHGKPCLECGAEQIWAFPVEREVKE